MNLKKLFLTVCLFTSTSAFAEPLELTVPPKGYSGVIKRADLVERQNSNFPLSDQQNKGNWQLNSDFSDEFNSSKLNTERWYPNRGFVPIPSKSALA